MRPDSKVGGNDPWLENPQLHCLTETTHMYVILCWQELKNPCFQLDRTCRPPQCYVFRRRGPLMRSGNHNGGGMIRHLAPLHIMPINGGAIRRPAPTPLKSW